MGSGGQRIDPKTFREYFDANQLEKIEGCTVAGEISFNGATFPRGVRLLNVTFEGPVDFSDARIAGSLDLSGCVFARTLRLDNSEIQGDLVLDGVRVEAISAWFDGGEAYDFAVVADQFSATTVRVWGNLQARNLFVMGNASFAGAHVRGSLAFARVQIRGSLIIAGIRCDGDLVIAEGEGRGHKESHIANDLALQNGAIGGNLIITAAVIGRNCELWSVSVGGWVHIHGRVKRDSISGELKWHPVVVGGDLRMMGSEIRSSLQLEGITVAGTIQLWASKATNLLMTPLDPTEGWPFDGHGVNAREIVADGIEVTNSVTLHCVNVFGDPQTFAGISFRGSRIVGDFLLWSRQVAKYYKISAAEVGLIRVRCAGDVDLRGSRIGGTCNLTALLTDGSIRLDDAEIVGDLTCLSNASLWLEKARGEAVGEEVLGWLRQAVLETSARQLSMTMASFSSDVDLSGLALRATKREVQAGEAFGRIDAAGVKIGGKLHFFQEASGQAAADGAALSFARIPGRAILTGCQIGNLVVSRDSFADDGAQPEYEGLCLDGGRIDELDVRARNPAASGGAVVPWRPFASGGAELAFPVPLSLADLAVRSWKIGETDDDRGRRYASLLECDPEFRASTYLAVERSLRNAGHEADADHIYRAMKKRAWKTGRPRSIGGKALRLVAAPFRKLFWDWGMGFGTAPSRLLLPILLLMGVSYAGVNDDPRNFEPTLVNQATNKLDPDTMPSPWGVGDAAWMTLRGNVPVVALGARSDWELSDDARRPLMMFGHAWDWLRPEDWGMLMMLINYPLWPLLLAFLIRRALRQA